MVSRDSGQLLKEARLADRLPAEELLEQVVRRPATLIWPGGIILRRRGRIVRRGGRRWTVAIAAGAQTLLDQVAERFAEGIGLAAARRVAVRGAARCKETVAQLLQLGIGRVRIVEDAGHVGIDARRGPRPVDHHGNAEAYRI